MSGPPTTDANDARRRPAEEAVAESSAAWSPSSDRPSPGRRRRALCDRGGIPRTALPEEGEGMDRARCSPRSSARKNRGRGVQSSPPPPSREGGTREVMREMHVNARSRVHVCSRCGQRDVLGEGKFVDGDDAYRWVSRRRRPRPAARGSNYRFKDLSAVAARTSVAAVAAVPKMLLSKMTLVLIYLWATSSSYLSARGLAPPSVDAAPASASAGGTAMSQDGAIGDVGMMDDNILEDMLVSDDDGDLDDLGDDVVSESRERRRKIRVQSSPGAANDDEQLGGEENHESQSAKSESEKDSVIILSAVDGTLAGVSRSSGQVLWRQSASDDRGSGGEAHPEWNKFLSPLVSTSTKSLEGPGAPGRRGKFHAVPSIDGTVYLTGGDDGDGDGTGPDAGGGGAELTASAHVRDLVDRSPFVDARRRFFVGSRRAAVAAVDERTGEILRVVPRWDRGDGDGGEEEALPPSLEGRDVVWIGRLEHTVTVHDLNKGTVDVEFSVAEVLSVDEMIHGDGRRRRDPPLAFRAEEGDGAGKEDDDDDIEQEEEEMERMFTEYIAEALRHPSSGDRILRLPAPDGEEAEDEGGTGRRAPLSSVSRRGSPFVISTPGGNVAFRDDDSISSAVGWVSFGLLDSPVVYAIEASSGHKIRVNMLDDSSVSRDGSGKEGLPHQLEKQIASIDQSTSLAHGAEEEGCGAGDKPGECRAVGFAAQGSVVGALRNGQIYALPLGERATRPEPFPLGLPQPHSAASDFLANANNAHEHKLNVHHAMGFHEHRQDSSVDDVDSGDGRPIHLDARHKQSCTPASPLYPGCLIGASLMLGNLLDVDGNLDMASVFASSDLDYDLYLDMLEAGNNRNRGSFFQQFKKIMSSWIAPTVALIFVVSFEMGRRTRERLKAEARIAANAASGVNGIGAEDSKDLVQNTAPNSGQGVIQLSEDILGYGGHGTVVYRGVLDGRRVAVKRLLATYHASADREISLLIESDGHPNVVRYFLKEARGEFVYLALELCDLSLNDLIVSLGKLRGARKENFQLSPSDGTAISKDLESATKSLLFQIASGVRHIHSLRIVHRDLKPQNILLALQGKSKGAKLEESGGSDSETEFDDTTHTTCSDTNAILERFTKEEYVPKISDMGLGKQLAGQSSFGLSTLGTGSVGGGAAGDAGAGAGSVGWQAPEVMAQRWSSELMSASNNNSEATEPSLMEDSPLEPLGANNLRTSRSVDIFSLGCVFYCTILPGSHPFGEWYEREANIMKNSPKKEDLEFVSPDASDLILSMIHRDAKARPTAEDVCEHPFFWSLSKRLKFLCELSDRIESCDAPQDGRADDRPTAFNIFAIEKGAANIFGASWEKKLDPELMEASLTRRTYDPSSVRDCLRMIRNKHHHYDELPAKLKSRIGSSTDGLSNYVTRTFPKLLMHCYHFCVESLAPEDTFATDYKLPIVRHLKSNKSEVAPLIADLSPLKETKECPLETIRDDDDAEQDIEEQERDEGAGSLSPETDEREDSGPQGASEPSKEGPDLPVEIKEDQIPPSPRMVASPRITLENAQLGDVDLSGMVIWAGSNMAKESNCRGWYRSDEEWIQRLDSKLRKRDSNLTRCADDPKFRTRLCNHWDVSQGTFCPMKKKNKCIFAHGPVELRVKEGKRQRWGTLVRKDGLCANPCASGGEDTYGAARSIEKTRKEQGQWTVGKGKGKPKGGKGPKKKDKS